MLKTLAITQVDGSITLVNAELWRIWQIELWLELTLLDTPFESAPRLVKRSK